MLWSRGVIIGKTIFHRVVLENVFSSFTNVCVHMFGKFCNYLHDINKGGRQKISAF